MAWLLSLAGPAAKGVIAAGIIGTSASPAAPPETSSITVRTYNLANAPTEYLVQANYSAGQIFKQAGIAVRWLSCALSLQEARANTACEEATGRHDFDVVVSTAAITRPGIATDASLGYAFPLARRSHAVVLWERSKKMAESNGVPAGIILGHATAHELGHLLLHSVEHSRTGIMRSRWGKEDLLRAESGRLLFTTGQAEAMRVVGLGAQPTEPLLTVRVYDLAQVGADDLHQATERADIIFRQAGIRIRWVVVPPVNEVHEDQDSEEWNPSDIHLRLWPRAGIGSNTFSEDTLGFRLSTEKSTAIIIADEVRNRAVLQFTNPGELLGLVMAHEIGHLLLRSRAHSAEGIMQAQISPNLRDRRRTLLVFTRKQTASMQDEVRRRMGIAIPRKC